MKCDMCPGGDLEKHCKSLQCQCYRVPYARAHEVVRDEFLKLDETPEQTAQRHKEDLDSFVESVKPR